MMSTEPLQRLKGDSDDASPEAEADDADDGGRVDSSDLENDDPLPQQHDDE